MQRQGARGDKDVQAEKVASSHQRAWWGLSVWELSFVPVQIEVYCWLGACLDLEIFL